MDNRRVRPKPDVGLHAHGTEEAIAIETEMNKLHISAKCTSGILYEGNIYLPSTYSFLMMKLFALNDQVDREDKGFGRKHAADIYSLIAMLTETEYKLTQKMSTLFENTPQALQSANIVQELFESVTSAGMLRIHESLALPISAETDEFRTLLAEIFPATANASPS